MAWTSMHFATGMAGSALLTSTACLLFKRSPKYLPLIITAGGLFAITPDLPRIWREDFPSLPLASILGEKSLEQSLHNIGDLFFLHATLDRQPHEYALHGLALIVILYLAASIVSLLAHRHERNKLCKQIQKLEHHSAHIHNQFAKPDNRTSSATNNR
ncbi:hypothetical protein KS4_15340 [Poriferisphaera corsica]|uniref:Uncharacterized protein n=1 Tax=Poriferisphaera corsica TaxID=2528020 RepID=A0A517YTD7_9BACT|nr:hypothetical protein [Poriferisphaera corsica]QDU33484.1 hypothetical protein KS4_15340 [Poriferisphaera corsica]